MIEQTLPHQHTVLGWVHHHFMEISLVWFPAFMGYLNGFAASFKVMGWTKLADFCGRLEDAVKAFVDARKAQQKEVKT